MSSELTDLDLPVYDMKEDGVYGTDLGDGRFLFLNTTASTVSTEINHGAKSGSGEMLYTPGLSA